MRRMEYKQLLALLGQGMENARSARELANTLGVDDTRTIRFMVNTARRDGELICSGPSGYWRPGNRLELLETYRRLSSKAITLLKALAPSRQRLGVLDGQVDLILEVGQQVNHGEKAEANS